MNDNCQKIKLGVETLQRGVSFRFADLCLSAPSLSSLVVTGWSHYTNLDNLSKEIAKSELEDIINSFNNIVNISPEMKQFLNNRKIEYCLDLDYGQGAVRVCCEKNGSIEWFID